MYKNPKRKSKLKWQPVVRNENLLCSKQFLKKGKIFDLYSQINIKEAKHTKYWKDAVCTHCRSRAHTGKLCPMFGTSYQIYPGSR